jgi:beta-aspartyl-peptidase (threonine type)
MRKTSSRSTRPALIVHGGAWRIPDDVREECREGCRRALDAGWKVLSRGGPALDAVEEAIVVLEDATVFDAGVGAHLDADGRVTLDAIVMDGETLAAGAVAAVGRLRNPIRAARAVMERSPHLLLVGEGAERFAEAQGLPLCRPEELMVERERQAWSRCRAAGGHRPELHTHDALGTVGAAALDRAGRIAAGTSTGGTCLKLPGRVGDSPLIGCGCYADGALGAASCTGLGEAIMKVVLAKTAVDALRGGRTKDHPQRVARRAVRLLAARTAGQGGIILLDRRGNCGAAFNTPHMAWGCVSTDGTQRVFI